MNKPPAFQFYPKDFLSDTNVVCLTNEELGAYIRLLCHCWLGGSLPTDDKKLAKLSNCYRRWGHVRVSVIGLFSKTEDNRYVHKRLTEERVKQLKHSGLMKEAANKRWQKNHAKALPKECSSSSSSSSSSVKKKTSKEKEILPDNLDPELWEEYKTHRKQMKKTLTEIATKRALIKLSKMTDPNLALTNSMENGWTGIHPPDGKDPRRKKLTPRGTEAQYCG
jgi:uncharacterized protein YdaU (DUF1376 family)